MTDVRQVTNAERLRRLIAIGALLGTLAIAIFQSHTGLRGVADDFITRYAAAEVSAEGESPYEGIALYERELELGGNGVRAYDPPILDAVLLPLTWVPVKAAAFALNGLSLLTCALIGWWIARGRSPMILAVAIVGVLVASPTRFALSLGAPDIVVLGAVLLFAHTQPAVGILKPQTGGLVAAGSFSTGPRPFRPSRLLVALAGFVVVLVLPALVVSGATWAGWVEALTERPRWVADLWAIQVGLFVAGLAVLVRGVMRSRATGRSIDLIAVACACCSLLAVMGHWNGYWHLAHVLPLGAVLLAVRTEPGAGPGLPAVRLSPLQQGLLLVTVAAAGGDAYTPNSVYGTYIPWVPVAAVAGVAIALVALREIRAITAAAVVVLNAIIMALPLEVPDRAIVPMAVGVALTYFLFELRTDPLPEDLPAARRSAALIQAR